MTEHKYSAPLYCTIWLIILCFAVFAIGMVFIPTDVQKENATTLVLILIILCSLVIFCVGVHVVITCYMDVDDEERESLTDEIDRETTPREAFV